MVKSIADSKSMPDGVVLGLAKGDQVRVLHVDDDPDFSKVAKQCLEVEGKFQVDIALSAEEAMGKLKRETYDVVVSDYVMPGKNGLDFLKELRKGGNNVPFIIFTGKGREDTQIEALKLGADGYFSKIGSSEAVYGELARGLCQAVESKRAEKALRKDKTYLKAILDSMSTGLIVIDEETHKIVDANSHALEMIGASRKDVIGKACYKLICSAEKGRCPISDLGQTVDKLESVLLRPDGEKKPILKTVVMMTWKGRKYLVESFIDMTEQSIDITEMKHYEASLSALNIHGQKLNTAESMKEIYQLTMDAVEKTLGFAIAFLMVVGKDKLRVVNHRGYPSSFSFELPLDGTKRGIAVKVARTGKTINVQDAKKEDDWVEFMPGIRSGLDVPIKIEHRVLGVIGVDSKEIGAFDEKDQQLVEILASHTATAMSNLDRAKRLETYAREIQESQQRFERLFVDNPEAAVHLDSSFHILNVNPRFTRLFGYSLDEAKGKHINDVIVPKERMEEAVTFDARASKGEIHHEDTVRKKRDGSLVPVAFSSAPIIVENQIVGHIAVYKDISQLKKTEEELIEALKNLGEMNEKLRVVGELTRHDARNKLSAITGNVYLAKKKLVGNSEVMNNLKEVESAVLQMVRIFDFAKTYEMLGIEKLRYMVVEKMVNEAVSLFSDLKGVKLINNCHGLTVLADSLLRQLFYNLIDNSLKYGRKTKTITVHYEEIGSDRLKLVYEDDGVGIAEKEKKKLFHEGYGRGTGYGLYLIKKMCEGYGWDIQETGKEGVGAQFTITITRTGEKGETKYNIN